MSDASGLNDASSISESAVQCRRGEVCGRPPTPSTRRRDLNVVKVHAVVAIVVVILDVFSDEILQGMLVLVVVRLVAVQRFIDERLLLRLHEMEEGEFVEEQL